MQKGEEINQRFGVLLRLFLAEFFTPGHSFPKGDKLLHFCIVKSHTFILLDFLLLRANICPQLRAICPPTMSDVTKLLKERANEMGTNPHRISVELGLHHKTVQEWFNEKRPIPEKWVGALAGLVSDSKEEHKEFVNTWKSNIYLNRDRRRRIESADRLRDKYVVTLEAQPFTSRYGMLLKDIDISIAIHEREKEEEFIPVYMVSALSGIGVRKECKEHEDIDFEYFEDETLSAEDVFLEKMDLLKDYCGKEKVSLFGLVSLGYVEVTTSPIFDPHTYERSDFVLIPKKQLEHWGRILKRANRRNVSGDLRRSIDYIVDIYFREYEMMANKMNASRDKLASEFRRMLNFVKD